MLIILHLNQQLLKEIKTNLKKKLLLLFRDINTKIIKMIKLKKTILKKIRTHPKKMQSKQKSLQLNQIIKTKIAKLIKQKRLILIKIKVHPRKEKSKLKL